GAASVAADASVTVEPAAQQPSPRAGIVQLAQNSGPNPPSRPPVDTQTPTLPDCSEVRNPRPGRNCIDPRLQDRPDEEDDHFRPADRPPQ
ncbi:MAG: hypothetical protein LC634_09145, partial [Sphingomonadales bacterium]|nr:hypothetical protein [Sphingomonadales bacterium]